MRIADIFTSINGEVNISHQGSVCIFIRLAGCNCVCRYCDTQKYQDLTSGKDMTIDEVINTVRGMPKTGRITITGGEPMLQRQELRELVESLDNMGYEISIETNGSIELPWEEYWGVHSWVIDYKCSSSGMMDRMKRINFESAGYNDIIKFVIATRKDFYDALEMIRSLENVNNGNQIGIPMYAFSPMFIKNEMGVNGQELLSWILRDDLLPTLKTILNIQIHKIINVA